MRISSSMVFTQGVNDLTNLQDTLVNLQNQLSTGLRINSPADDPIGAAQVLNIQQQDDLNNQYSTNITNVTSSLTSSQTQLASAANLLQNTIQLAIQSGDASLSDTNRKALAQQVQSNYQQLLAIANSTDGTGVHLYAGSQGSTTPFTEVSPGNVVYNGNQVNRQAQINPSLAIQSSDNGNDIFMRIANGNGHFATSANSSNTGSGVIDTGSVTNAAALTGDTYQINFTVSGGVTQYSIATTAPTAAVVVPPTDYTPGDTLGVDGMSFSISGAPADGDSFTIAPASSQSMFTTLSNLANSLNLPSDNSAASAQQTNSRLAGLTNLNNALNSITKAETSVGLRLSQMKSQTQTNAQLDIGYQTAITNIQGLDYTSAISQYSQAQISLQAAQKTFVQTQSLSLFNYIQ